MSNPSAEELLERSILYYRGEPVGTAAACDQSLEAENYQECFIRDFVASALVFLQQGRAEIVRNFLLLILDLKVQQAVMPGHKRAPGLMPASFKVVVEAGEEQVVADFGDRAIGRVAPVDSAMWWMFLLRAYVQTSGDQALVQSEKVQEAILQTLDLYLKESFETAPTMLVPDGSFMIDRRMGVYGHPLEIQALFYGMLQTARELLVVNSRSAAVLDVIEIRIQALLSYVRLYYWVDRQRLNEIHRYKAEEFGSEIANVLNVYPESIPDWMDGWLDDKCGYLVGNVGPSRIDFRFFALGNLLSILMGLSTEEEAQRIMKLYELRWNELVGDMPVKICFPAVSGAEWHYRTGSDPKNSAWSYHNGGNWPVLLWPFVAAATKTGRVDLAERAFHTAEKRLQMDDWPEYYDGRKGSLIGRRANFQQTWSAAAYLVAQDLMHNAKDSFYFTQGIFTSGAE